MNPPLTRIDPSLPICWETPDTLRFGFDRAEARIAAPSAAAQRLVKALLGGVRTDRVRATLRELRSTRADWASVNTQLASALVSQPETPALHQPLRIGVVGSGRAASALLNSLRDAGFNASAFSHRLGGWQLVVIVERFIELPMLAEYRQAAGLPQLLVRFSDRSLSVGPLVEACGEPCLSCVMLHDVDADPALPVIAAQLVGQTPAAESLASTEAAAALAVNMIRHWQVGSSGSETPPRSRWRVKVQAGLPSPIPQRERVGPHPECGCRLNSALVNQPQR